MDINSTNLPCLTSALPDDTSHSRNSSFFVIYERKCGSV